MINDDSIHEQLIVTHRMGGMHEFQRTGVYPNNLKIYSTKYHHHWRIKLKTEAKEGVLKLKKIPIYNYKFNEGTFSYSKFENDVPITNWVLVEQITVLMVD